MLVAPKLRICRSERIPRQPHCCVRPFTRPGPQLVLTPWSNSEHFRCCPRTCRPLRDTVGALRWDKAGEHAPMSDMRRRDFITLLGGAAAWTLAAREPDVILAIGPEIGLKSALAVTRTVPIVMIAIDYDPLARGYITSLARPSGNITGVVFQQIELAAKRIQ